LETLTHEEALRRTFSLDTLEFAPEVLQKPANKHGNLGVKGLDELKWVDGDQHRADVGLN